MAAAPLLAALAAPALYEMAETVKAIEQYKKDQEPRQVNARNYLRAAQGTLSLEEQFKRVSQINGNNGEATNTDDVRNGRKGKKVLQTTAEGKSLAVVAAMAAPYVAQYLTQGRMLGTAAPPSAAKVGTNRSVAKKEKAAASRDLGVGPQRVGRTLARPATDVNPGAPAARVGYDVLKSTKTGQVVRMFDYGGKVALCIGASQGFQAAFTAGAVAVRPESQVLFPTYYGEASYWGKWRPKKLTAHFRTAASSGIAATINLSFLPTTSAAQYGTLFTTAQSTKTIEGSKSASATQTFSATWAPDEWKNGDWLENGGSDDGSLDSFCGYVYVSQDAGPTNNGVAIAASAALVVGDVFFELVCEFSDSRPTYTGAALAAGLMQDAPKADSEESKERIRQRFVYLIGLLRKDIIDPMENPVRPPAPPGMTKAEMEAALSGLVAPTARSSSRPR